MPLLSNITVLSLEQATTLPFLTQRLAREGARVIRVEPPGRGDPNLTTADLTAALNGIGVPVAKVNSLADVLAELLWKKAFVRAKDERSGTEVILPPLAEVSDPGLMTLTFPPRLGEHNEAIYGGVLGYDSRRLSSLKERGII